MCDVCVCMYVWYSGGSSSGGTSRNRQNSLNDDSVMDDFDMLNDLNTSRSWPLIITSSLMSSLSSSWHQCHHSPSQVAWSEGRRPLVRCAAFIKWTEWTLAMTFSGHDDGTINIVLGLLLLLLSLSSSWRERTTSSCWQNIIHCHFTLSWPPRELVIQVVSLSFQSVTCLSGGRKPSLERSVTRRHISSDSRCFPESTQNLPVLLFALALTEAYSPFSGRWK